MYLAPQREKLMALIEEGTYFVINRPRQFGKTTTLDFLTPKTFGFPKSFRGFSLVSWAIRSNRTE
ncbi:MAG: hypothetical protein AAB354_17530 [candidate division KSB1 bacterium]